MSGKRAERRLAAILVADVAGYSRLMAISLAWPWATTRSDRLTVS
jgi:hypothetical protein